MKFMLDGKELKAGDTLYYRDGSARNRGDIRTRKMRVTRLGRKFLYICNFFPENRMATQVKCQAGPDKSWIVPSHEYSLYEDRWSRDKALCDAAKEIRTAMENIERGSWRRTYDQIVDLQAALIAASEALNKTKEIGNP